MPENNRYLTCGVDSTIPLEIQLFLWECVDSMPAPKDYLQVFDLEQVGCMQSITHRNTAEYTCSHLIVLSRKNYT